MPAGDPVALPARGRVACGTSPAARRAFPSASSSTCACAADAETDTDPPPRADAVPLQRPRETARGRPAAADRAHLPAPRRRQENGGDDKSPDAQHECLLFS